MIFSHNPFSPLPSSGNYLKDVPSRESLLVGAVQKKTPKSDRTQGSSKNRGYLLSQLVGQYHRRW